MIRRVALLALAAAVLAIPVAGATAKSAGLPFELGTYSGSVGTGKFKFKIYKGSCEKERQVATFVKGVCFKAVSVPPLTANCPNGTTTTDELYEYNTHMSNSGKYSDEAVTSDTVHDTATRTIKFKLKGKKLTGTFEYKDTQYTNDGAPPQFLACTGGKLKLSGKTK